ATRIFSLSGRSLSGSTGVGLIAPGGMTGAVCGGWQGCSVVGTCATSGARTVLLGGGIGTCSRWPQLRQAIFVSPLGSGASIRDLQRGQAKRSMGGVPVSRRKVESAGKVGALAAQGIRAGLTQPLAGVPAHPAEGRGTPGRQLQGSKASAKSRINPRQG